MNEHQQRTRRATEAALAGAARAAQDPHRLAYHFMPPSGWMNDPNGLIQWGGRYHLFYQHNPYGPDWGTMHWGHAVSTDLVRWEHRPVALAPSRPYDDPSGGGGGCFSGSAVDDEDLLTLVYTGTSDHGEARQKQCIATSEDGVVFTKYEGNPVIPTPPAEGSPENFRDPKTWRHGGLWHMVVGSARGDRGNVLLYRSDDLRDWEFCGVAAESDGSRGRMWECPDLFPLGDRHLLVLSPIGVERRKSIALLGDFDYGTGRFTTEREMDTDYGPGFYAPQSFQDDAGRRIMFGWMLGGGERCPNKEYGWDGAQTLPRLVTALPDGSPSFAPVPELRSLRERRWEIGGLELNGGERSLEPRGDALEILAEFDADGEEFGLAVRCSGDGAEQTRIICRPAEGTVVLDPARSGRPADHRYPAPVAVSEDGKVTLHVFVDRSSVEVFTTGGRSVLTARIFPDPQSRGVRTFGTGRLVSLRAWEMADIWH